MVVIVLAFANLFKLAVMTVKVLVFSVATAMGISFRVSLAI